MKKIPITILTGYLGSGKTILLNHILYGDHGKEIAVIVNDIGEVNVDGVLVDKKGFKRTGEKLVSMPNGCICCTLREDLIVELDQLVQFSDLNQIVIEASGISKPIPIIQAIILAKNPLDIDLTQRLEIGAIIIVVDVKRFWDNFETGEKIQERKAEGNVVEEEQDIRGLLIDQFECCNILLLNNSDLVSTKTIYKINGLIAKLQSNAKIIRTIKGEVDLSKILNTNLFNIDETSYSVGWFKELELGYQNHIPETEEYGISSFIYRNRLLLDAQKFAHLTDKNFPGNITRAKRFLWFAQHSDFSTIFETSGSHKSIESLNYWVASLPKIECQMIIQKNPELKEAWHPLFGERINKLVFIGMKMDQQCIKEQLEGCLTDSLNADNFRKISPFPWKKSNMFSQISLMKFLRKAGVKIGDVIIIGILIITSFIPLFVFSIEKENETTEDAIKYAIVRIDGKEMDRFDLDKINHKLVNYHPAKGQYNIVEIKDGRIRVKEDNSPDQIAVRTGWISKPGQTSICLPHKLVISIEKKESTDYYIY
ncbi:NusG domain II-containing protein [Enterococcus faecium]